MQTQLPIFPSDVKLFNPHVGVFFHDEFVFYMHNGSPLFCHTPEDRNSYRYITANLVQTHLCRPSEIARVFGVSIRSIQLNAKALHEKGPSWFFNRVETRGKCYKFTPETIAKAEGMLNKGKSKIEVARELGVSDSAISYHIRKGNIKKI
jgi:hypothetical protein